MILILNEKFNPEEFKKLLVNNKSGLHKICVYTKSYLIEFKQRRFDKNPKVEVCFYGLNWYNSHIAKFSHEYAFSDNKLVINEIPELFNLISNPFDVPFDIPVLKETYSEVIDKIISVITIINRYEHLLPFK